MLIITDINKIVMYIPCFYILKYNCIITNAICNSHIDIHSFSINLVNISLYIYYAFQKCLFCFLYHFCLIRNISRYLKLITLQILCPRLPLYHHIPKYCDDYVLHLLLLLYTLRSIL